MALVTDTHTKAENTLTKGHGFSRANDAAHFSWDLVPAKTPLESPSSDETEAQSRHQS